MLIHTQNKQQIINVALAFLLLLFSASFLSLNIFTVPVEKQVPSFTALWSRALGFASVFDSIATLSTVSLIDVHQPFSNDEENPLTWRVRIAAIPISICYLSLSLTVFAMKYTSKLLLYLSVIPQVIPFAVFYLVSIRALTEWIPKHPEVAMTFVSASFGASQFILLPIIYATISYFGLQRALVGTSFSLFFCVLICASMLRFPTANESQLLSGSSNSSSNSNSGLENRRTEEYYIDLPRYEIIRTKEFYGYIAVVFLSRTASCLLYYFFKLGSVFHLPTHIVVIMFQVLSLTGIAWSVLVNSSYNYVSKFTKSPVRPLLFIIFTSQSLLYASLIPISIANNSYLAMFTISLLVVMLESQTAFAVILAQYIFGSRNGVIAYGLSIGVAIGPSEGFFTGLMSIVELRFSPDGVASPKTFLLFYVFASLCLITGAIMVVMQKKCRKAFHSQIL